jgi:hypothetical protein
MWVEIKDGNQRARMLADRHYSRQTVGANLFVGPGRKVVLMTEDGKALFAWRKSKYRLDGQKGVECTIFRNEGPQLSSELIKEACLWAWYYWPRERLFTYVNAKKIKSNNPGCCFIKAGWRKCGTSKAGLILLENTHPVHEIPPGAQKQLCMLPVKGG